jgi:hypothetical protein
MGDWVGVFAFTVIRGGAGHPGELTRVAEI